MNEFMTEANKEVLKNQKSNFKDGGPFGAVIVKNGKIVARAHNTVRKSKDATAHAEINAIRLASKKLNTHDLSDCEIYTTYYPCPMCLSACIWANIKTIYYGNTKEDTGNINFRDDYIYKILENPDKYLKLIQLDRNETIKAFNEFKKHQENLY